MGRAVTLGKLLPCLAAQEALLWCCTLQLHVADRLPPQEVREEISHPKAAACHLRVYFEGPWPLFPHTSKQND